MNKGLIILNTGNGKGKTTAALGLALRAAGQDMKVCFIQFIKGIETTGEAKACRSFAERIEFHVLGSGFSWEAESREEVAATALKAWEFARRKIMSGQYDMVILDEFTYLTTWGILPDDEVLNTLQTRPEGLHIVITGRNASKDLISAADLVTEMKEIKHPFSGGGKAVKGIEF